jgi:hypothetical protein
MKCVICNKNEIGSVILYGETDGYYIAQPICSECCKKTFTRAQQIGYTLDEDKHRIVKDSYWIMRMDLENWKELRKKFNKILWEVHNEE